MKEERIIDRQIANSPPAYEEALGHTAQKEMHTTNRSNSTEQDGQLLLQPDPLLSYCFLNTIRLAKSSCSIIQPDLEDVSTLCLASLEHIKVDA